MNSIDPSSWKEIVKQKNNVSNYVLTLDHHVFKAGRYYSVDKLIFKELYSILLLKNNKKTLAKYFVKLLKSNNLECSAIYLFTLNVNHWYIYLRSIQYKFFNDMLYLNKNTLYTWLQKFFHVLFVTFKHWSMCSVNVTLSFLSENNWRHTLMKILGCLDSHHRLQF